jgi:hypothetical protein
MVGSGLKRFAKRTKVRVGVGGPHAKMIVERQPAPAPAPEASNAETEPSDDGGDSGGDA